MKRIFTILIAILPFSVWAQTVLMDNFALTGNDTLAAQTVNNGWINSATPVVLTNALRATGAPLTYTGYVGSGVGASVPFATSGQDILRDAKASYTSGNVYASFLIKVTSAQTGDYFFGLVPQTSNTLFTCRTHIKHSSTGYFKVGIMKGSSTLEPVTAYSNDSFAYNSTYLMVVKYEFIAGTTTNDSCKVFVFSSGIPATEPANATVATIGGTNTDATAIGRVLLRQGAAGSSAVLSIGALRLSPTWAHGPLPVEFLGFNASLNDGKVDLNWATASESHNKGFEVERSDDGNTFSSIGFVAGAGHSSKTNKYNFTDAAFNGHVAYYRLRQIDMDGSFSYSEVVRVEADLTDIKVTPNPFSDVVTVQSGNDMINAEIVDLNGRVKSTASGFGSVNLDTRELSSGIYFVRIQQGETTTVKRIIRN